MPSVPGPWSEATSASPGARTAAAPKERGGLPLGAGTHFNGRNFLTAIFQWSGLHLRRWAKCYYGASSPSVRGPPCPSSPTAILSTTFKMSR
eukprot:6650545-Pyramimonas_sp.AAC.1